MTYYEPEKRTTDPSTTNWGSGQSGRLWYNSTDKLWKYWDGSAISPLTTGSGGGGSGISNVVFYDSFENGWDWDHITTSVVTAGSGPQGIAGSTWSLESSVVYSGSYAAQFTLPASSDAWANVYKTLGAPTYYPTLYAGGWVRYNATVPSGNYLMLGPCICGYNDHDLAAGYIYNNGGTLQWSLLYYTNANSDVNFSTSNYGPAIAINTWYYILIMVTTGGAGTGQVAMWVNGTQVAGVSGITNNGDTGPSGQIGALNLQVGPYEPAFVNSQVFTVTTWHDDTTASTSYINYASYGGGGEGVTAFTFGRTTVGDTGYTESQNYKDGSKFTCNNTGTITSISCYMYYDSGIGNARAAIYADSGGTPAGLIAQTNEASVSTSYSWVTFTFSSPVSVTSGTSYWLSILFNASAHFYVQSGTPQNVANVVYDAYSDGFSNPFGTYTIEDDEMCIYASGTY